jgi:histidine ammonia-lyase
MTSNSAIVDAAPLPAFDRRVIKLGSDTLTWPDVALVAKGMADLSIEMSADVTARIERSVALKHELLKAQQPIYGVTTGFGDSNVRHISPGKAAALQDNLVKYHLVGSGPAATDEVVRATMLVRANCLARGYSAVRLTVIQRLLDCLSNDILPLIPERGSVGASGDLVPLCYLAYMLTGSGEARFRGEVRPAGEVLRECGLEPLALEAKEALGLINGTSFMAAFAVLALDDAAEIAFVADLCTAFSSEALLGNRGHFDALIHEQKPHPGQVRSAAAVRELLTGSTLSRDHTQILLANLALGEKTYQRLEHPIQDRYSVRCAPHVVGVLHDTLEWAGRWIDIEISSTNDNPLFDPDSRAVYNGGNFYGGHVGQAMDALKIAVASVGDLLDRQFGLVVDEKFNNGLTPNLIRRLGDDDYDAGLHHGFKGAQIACSALAAEALKLSSPATVFSRSTEAHNQDKVSMGTIAARDARTIVDIVADIAAIHLTALCQAADLRGADRLGSGTRAAFELVRESVPFLDRDRRMDGDLAAVRDLIRSGALRRGVSAATTR